jgi:hypothetical protein
MNFRDRVAEFLLTAKDRLMNVVTFGLWERIRGEVTWSKIKIKKGA